MLELGSKEAKMLGCSPAEGMLPDTLGIFMFLDHNVCTYQW